MKLKLSILIILTVRILVAADENDSKVTIGSTVLHGINLVNASGGYANGTIVTHYNELDGTRELFAGENILARQFASDFWGVLQQSVPDTQIGKYIQNDIDVEQPDYLSILPYLRECIAECDTVWIELTWSTNYDNKGDQAINSVRKCTYEVLGNLQDVPITLAEGMLRKEGNRVFFDWTSHGMTYTTLDSALNKINALNDAGETAKWNALFSATHPLNKRIYFKNRVSRNSETPETSFLTRGSPSVCKARSVSSAFSLLSQWNTCSWNEMEEIIRTSRNPDELRIWLFSFAAAAFPGKAGLQDVDDRLDRAFMLTLDTILSLEGKDYDEIVYLIEKSPFCDGIVGVMLQESKMRKKIKQGD